MSRQNRFHWFTTLQHRKVKNDRHFSLVKSSFARRLHVEVLEDRRMLAAFTVSSLSDAGAGSLREAITLANGNGVADTIDFSVTDTINIVSQLPTITDAVTITGPGQELLTIDAGNGTDNLPGTADGYRLLNINDGDYKNEINVEISGLTLTGGDTSGGGGAISSGENLTVISSTLSGNSASYGGGIYNNRATLAVTSSTLSGNSARSSDGGGIFSSGTATVTSSTLSGNSADSGGGILNRRAVTITSAGSFFSSATVTVTSSTLYGNTATFQGGGIYNRIDSTVTVTSSTLSGNSAFLGGGIHNKGGTLVTSSTLSGNSAESGGGIFSSGTAHITLDNTIVANSPSGGDIDNSSTLTGAYNLIEDGSGGGVLTNTIGGDPLLGPLKYNGGPTQTHALLVGSPAVDVGRDSVTEATDQRGAPFLRNDGNGVDIGALERQTVVDLNLVVDTMLDENDGDYSAGDLSLREAIGLANGNVGADTITFSTLFNTAQAIALGSQLPTITDAVTITGPGQELLTIDAGNGTDNLPGTADGYRLLNINDGDNNNEINVEISGLTLTGGDVAPGDLFGSGGAIRNRENLTVNSNTLFANSASFGGGIFNFGTATVTSSILNDNSASFGGGINNIGTVTVTSSTISGNSADRSGGGIYSGGVITVTSSTLSGNTATSKGGGIYNRGTATVTNSTLSGNSSFTGGGIYSSGTATVTNSTLSGNSAAIGGGIDNRGTATVSNSTLSDNSASPRYGGGIFNGSVANFTLDSTIVANSPRGGDIDNNGTLSGSYNLIEYGIGSGLTNTISGDPLLGPLQYNGGPTQTHALLAVSPAIDTGDPAAVAGSDNVPLDDQRGTGFPRVFGAAIDIGAVERQTAVVAPLRSFVVDTIADELDDDYGPGDLSLREAIIWANLLPGLDSIVFAPTLDGGTITLILGHLTIIDSLTIDASVLVAGITIDATGNDPTPDDNNGDGSRIFNIDDGNDSTIDVELRHLTLTGGDTSGGGAISSGENLTVISSTISGNSGSGGGALINFGTANVTSSTISDNSAGNGGGIVNIGTVTITSSTISGNSAHNLGGGISNYGTATVTSSTISGNTVGYGDLKGYGGGISNFGTVTVTGSTLSGNTAGYGGGIHNFGAATVTSSTFSGNTAGSGGGIFNSDTANLTLDNTIVANSPSGGDINDNGTLTGAYNLIEDGSSGGLTNTISGDPLLGPLADNGGPTMTHALLAGSPAIDAGDPAAVAGIGSVPLDDQRGDDFSRVRNGRIDIGSYEVVPDSADFDGDGFVTGLDFLAWQLGFGISTPTAAKTDGDADNDGDVDGVDLGFWESQFGQPATVVTAVSSPVPETPIEVELITAFQIEITALSNLSPEEPTASRFPANFILTPSDFGIGLSFAAAQRAFEEAIPFTEHIDQTFSNARDSFEQQNDLTSDNLIRTKQSRRVQVVQSVDEAFAMLADDEGFAGLR